MLTLLLSILFGPLIVFGITVFLRFLGRMEVLWLFNPENTFSILVSDENPQGGGSVVDLLHSVPGHRIDMTTNPDPMEWEFVDGEEDRGFLFRQLGIQWKGLFPKVRKNEIKQFRYGRDGEKDEYTVRAKSPIVKHVFFSADEHVSVNDVETAGNFRLNFLFNFIYERTRPVRSILRVSDANAYLTTMTMELVNQIVGKERPETYLGGKKSAQAKKQLSNAIRKRIKGAALRELGITITEVNLYQVSADKATVEYLEKVEKARRDKKVKVIEARGDRESEILRNDGKADYVERVIKETARTPGGPAVRFADAYEKNTHVTTFAPGGNGLGLIVDPRGTPSGTKKNSIGFNSDEEEVSTNPSKDSKK